MRLLGQLEPPCTSNPEKVVVAGITTITQGSLSPTPCVNFRSERPHPLTPCVTPTTAGSIDSTSFSFTVCMMPSTTDSQCERPHPLTSCVTPTIGGSIASSMYFSPTLHTIPCIRILNLQDHTKLAIFAVTTHYNRKNC